MLLTLQNWRIIIIGWIPCHIFSGMAVKSLKHFCEFIIHTLNSYQGTASYFQGLIQMLKESPHTINVPEVMITSLSSKCQETSLKIFLSYLN